MQRKDKVVDQLGKGVSSLVKAKGATILSGMAQLVGEGQVEVTESEGKTKVFKAKEIVLATGSKPTELPFLPFDGKVVVNSDQGIALERVPKKLVVVGGGAIGPELGCVWSHSEQRSRLWNFYLKFARSWIPKWPRQPARF